MSDRHDDDRELREAIASWRDRTPAAPVELRARVLHAVAETTRADDPAPIPFARRSVWRRALATAAALAMIAILVARALPDRVESSRGRLVVADALEEVRAAEAAHARAIARLEATARPVLARAHLPETSPAEAARLLAYGGRLASIDTAIARVRAHLDDNPGLASARTVLLAAYLDKTALLEELLETHGDIG